MCASSKPSSILAVTRSKVAGLSHDGQRLPCYSSNKRAVGTTILRWPCCYHRLSESSKPRYHACNYVHKSFAEATEDVEVISLKVIVSLQLVNEIYDFLLNFV